MPLYCLFKPGSARASLNHGAAPTRPFPDKGIGTMSEVLETPGVPPVSPKKRGGGPKTSEGKARAKYNSMKHGLRAKVLLPAELVAAYEGRKAELTRQFAPATQYEAWLVGEMAMAMARLDRCADLAACDLQ